MTGAIKIIAVCLFFTATTSCVKKTTANNELTEEEKAAGYVLLFDGKTTAGWHVYNQGDVNSAWQVADGELYCDAAHPTLAHGDLVTNEEFENYEMKFEWKIPEKGNSGVFINVKEDSLIPTAWASGPEYQLLDQKHHDYPIETKRPGCLYGFTPQLNPVEPKPAGDWNQSSIKQVNGKIEFYLNGILTAQQDFNAESWKEMISKTNFKNFPEFGKRTKGHLALQEWEKKIYFKNIKIKKL